MTGKEFLKAVANGRIDVVQLLLRLLEGAAADYCVIGGLAVNAYAEPVVSLDLDVVVISDKIEDVIIEAQEEGMKAEELEHSIHLSAIGSDLRIQLQTDDRYQDFLVRAESRQVLGYEMFVASLEDVVRGKIWAYSDPTRSKSKRQKDLSDIMRLVEDHPSLLETLPAEISKQFD
jgi:hypothetical protein